MRLRVGWSLSLLLLLWAGPVQAAEIHSFFDITCKRTTGIVVEVSSQSVGLVELGGTFMTLERESISAIAMHKTLENPLRSIVINPALRERLRDVWVGDDRQKTFTGWTAGFFDELYIYFDINGQTHVLDPEEIERIEPSSILGDSFAPKTYGAANLAFPAEVLPCGSAQIPPDSAFPSRVIADRIKVGEYLDKLEQRYLEQAEFEERTKVYASPFLFDQQSRLGLMYDPDWDVPFPLYFRWSGGRPYRFQSLSVVGNSAHEWLPIANPTMSVRSDVKSHFFHASFVGHVLALPAGTDPFQILDLDDFGDMFEFPDSIGVRSSYNYVLLMGVDWWRLSISAGTSYLAARVTAPQSPRRTVLADGASPTVRLRYQGPNLQLRALYFRTRSNGAVKDAITQLDTDDIPDELEYSWQLDTIRLGATWKPHQDVEILLDEIMSRGKYHDDLPFYPISLDFLQFVTSAELAVNFGRYVTVRGTSRLSLRKFDLAKPMAKKESDFEIQFGGALEFVF